MATVIKQIIIFLAPNQSVQEGCFGINVMHQVALQVSKSHQKVYNDLMSVHHSGPPVQ